jgi:hypothetical protein
VALPSRRPVPATTVTVSQICAAWAELRAVDLQIDVATFVRVLIRNDQARPQPRAIAEADRSDARYVKARLGVRLSRRERLAIAATLAPGESLSSYVEQILDRDRAEAGDDLTIIAREGKAALRARLAGPKRPPRARG